MEIETITKFEIWKNKTKTCVQFWALKLKGYRIFPPEEFQSHGAQIIFSDWTRLTNTIEDLKQQPGSYGVNI